MPRAATEGSWAGNGDTYRTRGARVWRVPGQGWFVSIEQSRRFRGPLSNALSAMEAADRMLSEAQGEKTRG